MEKETVVKNTIYLFKKFLRDKGKWEAYKALSNPLNGWGEWENKPLLFKELIEQCEPVELIQGSKYFCIWPNGQYDMWRILSQDWAIICFENNLFYDLQEALLFTKYYISPSLPLAKAINRIKID
jgi:hypothetical protein